MSEESAQEKYDRVIASEHGGLGGFSSDGETFWRPDSPVGQEWAAQQYEQELAAAQEPYSEPEPYYDSEAAFDPDDYLREMVDNGIQDELGGSEDDWAEHDALIAQRQAERDRVEGAQYEQAVRQLISDGVDAAYGGRAQHLGEQRAGIEAATAGLMSEAIQEAERAGMVIDEETLHR